MDGLYGAGEACTVAQFGEGHVRFGGYEFTQPLLVGGQYLGLALAVGVERGEVSGVAPLAQELADGARRDGEKFRHFFLFAPATVKGGDDAFA